MSDLNQIELSMEEAQKKVRFVEALDKLGSNREFKKVILEGYFRDEASRLVGLSADPNASEKQRAETILSIQAISLLQSFFRAKTLEGQSAANALEEAREELALIHAEGEEA